MNSFQEKIGEIKRAQNYHRGSANALLLVKVVIVMLLLVWMATNIASLFWRLVPQPKFEQAVLTENVGAFTAAAQPALPSVDIDALKSLSLFGEEQIKIIPEPEVEVVAEQVEETALNLELVGSFASDNQQLAYAIIANGNLQELYRVNDELTGLSHVKLISVFPDRVILKNRDRREALYMYPEGEPISSSTSVSPELTSQHNTDNASRALPGLSPDQRLEKISDVVRFSRKTKDGKMLGFRVLPGRNRKAFEQTGLQLNDVVTAIDGQVLDNLQAANQIYQQKRNAVQANLTVLRGDQVLSIDVDLNSINVN